MWVPGLRRLSPKLGHNNYVDAKGLARGVAGCAGNPLAEGGGCHTMAVLKACCLGTTATGSIAGSKNRQLSGPQKAFPSSESQTQR